MKKIIKNVIYILLILLCGYLVINCCLQSSETKKSKKKEFSLFQEKEPNKYTKLLWIEEIENREKHFDFHVAKMEIDGKEYLIVYPCGYRERFQMVEVKK